VPTRITRCTRAGPQPCAAAKLGNLDSNQDERWPSPGSEPGVLPVTPFPITVRPQLRPTNVSVCEWQFGQRNRKFSRRLSVGSPFMWSTSRTSEPRRDANNPLGIGAEGAIRTHITTRFEFARSRRLPSLPRVVRRLGLEPRQDAESPARDLNAEPTD
jgi:hypothetical protein